MRQFTRRSAAALVASAAMTLVSLAAPVTASAATAAPGAPIRIHSVTPAIEGMPRQLDAATCSQGPVGTVQNADGTTSEVMLTAAHCLTGFGDGWEPTSEVFAPLPAGDALIGYRDSHRIGDTETGDLAQDFLNLGLGPDWAVVKLEDGVSTTRTSDSVDLHGRSHGEGVALTGVRDYRDLRYRELSVDNFGQPICKDGTTSGRSCGVQLFRSQDSVYSYGLNYLHGDSGGINYDPDTREAIGMSVAAIGPIGQAQAADATLQEAYEIPDGQVNERFALAESAEPHDEFRTVGEDAQASQAWIEHNAPQEAAPPAEEADAGVNVFDEAAGEWANAQSDAQQLADQASGQAVNGDVAGLESTAEQAAQTAAGYADTFSEIAFG